MNLFLLDYDLDKNAQYHCDKHFKQILESAQLLCSAFWMQGIEAPYKLSHAQHPISKFTRRTRQNFEFVIDYARALAKEHNFRYGKWHKSLLTVDWAEKNLHRLSFDLEGRTEFELCMPDQYKTSCPIQSYRNYYIGEKSHLFCWTNRPSPAWIRA
jgi:hypothetical protein